MALSCPRCSGALAPAPDIGAGVSACSCGVFFVERDARIKLMAWLRITEDTWALLLEQGRRGPLCACGAPMKTAALKGVTVDGCATCGGLLLDPGELKALTGLQEPAAAPAPVPVDPSPHADLGRVFVPSRPALQAFAGTQRAFHLLQVKSEVAAGLAGPVNQPFLWTLASGVAQGTIAASDESTARQLLAFVTGNLVSSRFMLRDGRDNPVLVFVRKTKGLLRAQVDVLWADDEAPLGQITRSIVGLALDIADANGKQVLRFEKHLGDVWGFTVVDAAGRKVGDVTRGFGNVEMDMSLLGGFELGRSIRRDDFHLTFEDDVPLNARALAMAATFLVAHTSAGPAGLTELFN